MLEKNRNKLYFIKKQYRKASPKNTAKHSKRDDMRRKTTMCKSIKQGDVALIKGNKKNCLKWNMGIVPKLPRK